MKNLRLFFLIKFYFFISLYSIFADEQISAYKVENFENLPSYEVPQSSIFTINRPDKTNPKIIYYLTKPNIQSNKKIPITIFVGGSSSKGALHSVIHVHRYFLAEILGINSAMITLEQWGINSNKINEQEFFKHYTISQRYSDHEQIIKYLEINPPEWWNGNIILIGVSEGGPIVTRLAAEFDETVVATINWVGAGDQNWRDELWEYVKYDQQFEPLWSKIYNFIMNFSNNQNEYNNRQKYDLLMNDIILNPVSDKEFFGMTYKYHADAMNFLAPDYKKLTKPFLVVAGALDVNGNIQSTDDFIGKAKAAGANVTYLKVPDMDHYIRKRPDIIEQSFLWLGSQMKNN